MHKIGANSHQERVVCVAAHVDPRTLRRYLAGDPLGVQVQARIERALLELGREDLVRSIVEGAPGMPAAVQALVVMLSPETPTSDPPTQDRKVPASARSKARTAAKTKAHRTASPGRGPRSCGKTARSKSRVGS